MLEQTPTLVTAEQLGKLLTPPVSKQMIGKYRTRGIIKAASSRGERGAVLYDRDACLDLIKRNKAHASRHGGKRARSGRKRERPKDPGLSTEFDAAVTVAEIAGREEPPRGAVGIFDLLKFGPSELAAVIKMSDQVGLTIAHLDAMRQWLDVQRKSLDLERERGTLVLATDVEIRQVQLLAMVRQRVMELPAKLAAEVGSALGLDSAQRAAVRVCAEDLVNRQLSLLAGGAAGGAGE